MKNYVIKLSVFKYEKYFSLAYIIINQWFVIFLFPLWKSRFGI
jgi:hypothetical protein